VFQDRAVVEVRTSSPMAALRALDDLPTVEKTSPFGTALHVWLKPGVLDHGANGVRQHLDDASSYKCHGGWSLLIQKSGSCNGIAYISGSHHEARAGSQKDPAREDPA
ncbi:MAG: hypothetical protein HGB17_19455, partial [Syntrophobacteraceae bacterium]|nr:hypothetical protein [Syntrophobacteraceae bacterium]